MRPLRHSRVKVLPEGPRVHGRGLEGVDLDRIRCIRGQLEEYRCQPDMCTCQRSRPSVEHRGLGNK